MGERIAWLDMADEAILEALRDVERADLNLYEVSCIVRRVSLLRHLLGVSNERLVTILRPLQQAQATAEEEARRQESRAFWNAGKVREG